MGSAAVVPLPQSYLYFASGLASVRSWQAQEVKAVADPSADFGFL